MPAWFHQIGLILLGGVFVWAGADHFRRFAEVSAMLQERGFIAPRLMLAAGSLVEIAAGLCLAVGFHVAWAAAALVVFTIAASATLLDFWHHDGVARQGLRSAFIINVAVIGGLILAAAGPA